MGFGASAKSKPVDKARKAERTDKIGETAYKDHFLTGAMKMAKTKDNKYTKDRGEEKSYEDFTGHFSSESCDALRRPAVAISVMSSTLLDVAKRFEGYEDKEMVGPAYNWLKKGIERRKLDFQQLDTFHAGTTRSEATVREATSGILKWFHALSKHAPAKEFVMTMLERSVRELHLAHQMLQWMSFAESIPNTAKAIGFKALQPNSEVLKDLAGGSNSKDAFDKMSTWLADAVLKKNKEYEAWTSK